ncbi:MAG: ankyrin repeat domain-containing protein [Candidatus Midichloria sp.]|nr:ankyrin repeat domain-containing protein [Candidatus Midichloria sp.]
MRLGADINAVTTLKKATPLHLAARENCIETVRYLAEKGVEINLQDSGGATALLLRRITVLMKS